MNLAPEKIIESNSKDNVIRTLKTPGVVEKLPVQPGDSRKKRDRKAGLEPGGWSEASFLLGPCNLGRIKEGVQRLQ